MNYLTTLGAVALVMALYQPVAQNSRPNWQNGVPGGAYAQTCRDIRVSGNTLQATCQQRNSDNWTRTSLQNFNDCTSGIENIDGRLECTKGNYDQNNGRDYRRDGGPEGRDHDRNGVPNGAYAQNCRDIRINGSTLLATCQKNNGGWRQASLAYFNRCSSDIENHNGKLVCSR